MSDHPTKDHNVAARGDIIKRCCSEIAGLEAERKTIGDQIRAIKQKQIKGDLGMKIADFNAALRLHSLEDEARDEFFDTLRETFQALGVGQQLNFLGGDVRGNGEAAEPAPLGSRPVEPPTSPAEPPAAA